MVAMVFPRARLTVAALLFLGWIGFLAYLVATTRDPVILSRPQFLVAPLHIVAQVEEAGGRPAATVLVKEVAYARGEGDAKLAGTQLVVEDLPECGPAQGWKGPGDYILALSLGKAGDKVVHQVTTIPISPGYEPITTSVEVLARGADTEKTAALIRSFTGWPDDKARDFQRGTLKRNVRWVDAVQFKTQMEEAGAAIGLRAGEGRIYRATPDARKQLDLMPRPK
jgi:hypothetical protein